VPFGLGCEHDAYRALEKTGCHSDSGVSVSQIAGSWQHQICRKSCDRSRMAHFVPFAELLRSKGFARQDL